jgi:phosphate transporter
LFVTSLLVPFFCIVLQIVREDAKPNRRLTSKEAAGYVFASMWTPVIMLLLGGFTIAAALSKYNIAKMMATFVLSKAGTKPSTVLFTSMAVATFASMWISNVAAPVLCFSIIQVRNTGRALGAVEMFIARILKLTTAMIMTAHFTQLAI